MSATTIRLIVSDVDGVWTDGSIVYTDDGREIKAFNVRDGLGIKLAQQAGIRVAVITSRSSKALERRCRELGIESVSQGASDKLAELVRLAKLHDVPLGDVCYIGDDLPDLAPMSAAGLSAAPRDAAAEVRAVATWVLDANGGRGAVRELVERLLRARGVWESVIAGFRGATQTSGSI